MLEFLSDYFLERGIRLFAPVPLSACRVTRKYLLDRAEIAPETGTAVMLAIPYYSHAAEAPDRNLSAYAVPQDYHLFFQALFADLLPRLRERFPKARFAGFADHSPIDERDAAAHAGLGLIGKNGMLITQPYSSFVFLGELITSLTLPCTVHELRTCEDCGACRRACPMSKIGNCLSALTQKKGELTQAEQEQLLQYGSVWGCDICGAVCPHTKRALREGTIYSEIPFFSQQTVTHLTVEALDALSDEEFAARAFAWRGRDTIRRNLLLVQAAEQDAQARKENEPC